MRYALNIHSHLHSTVQKKLYELSNLNIQQHLSFISCVFLVNQNENYWTFPNLDGSYMCQNKVVLTV